MKITNITSTAGYLVRSAHPETVIGTHRAADIDNYIKAMEKLIPKGSDQWHVARVEEDGFVIILLMQQFHNRDAAVSAARARNMPSVYDLKKDEFTPI